MGGKRRNANDSEREDTSRRAKDAQAEERVRRGYEEASPPERQGDGDPAPRDITES